MSRLLFLDIDGVLNAHERHANGYSPIRPDLVANLNLILDAVPDLQIVLSSAWRYTMREVCSVETLLCCHGANAAKRIHGLTNPDPLPNPCPSYDDREWWSRMGLLWRVDQICDYAWAHSASRFAVLDDLPLEVDHLFLCDPNVGLTAEIADAVVRHFGDSGESREGADA